MDREALLYGNRSYCRMCIQSAWPVDALGHEIVRRRAPPHILVS